MHTIPAKAIKSIASNGTDGPVNSRYLSYAVVINIAKEVRLTHAYRFHKNQVFLRFLKIVEAGNFVFTISQRAADF